jgi:hypothetical protein
MRLIEGRKNRREYSVAPTQPNGCVSPTRIVVHVSCGLSSVYQTSGMSKESAPRTLITIAFSLAGALHNISMAAPLSAESLAEYSPSKLCWAKPRHPRGAELPLSSHKTILSSHDVDYGR